MLLHLCTMSSWSLRDYRLFLWLALPSLVLGQSHPECDSLIEWKKNETDCLRQIHQHGNETAGCKRIWDRLLCWPETSPGQTLTFPCPGILLQFTKQQGTIKRSCTAQGWSEPFPPYAIACPMEDEVTLSELSYWSTIKTIYTVGYSISTTSLAMAITILVAFRRLRCPRNYIHIQLFLTFILKAISVFIKDAVLFQTENMDDCSISTTECKISMVFCHFFTMTNFMWLLVEALYLNCLLLSSFPHGRRYFWWLVLFGWGVPTFFIILWILLKVHFEDNLCWDANQGSPYWWLIKGPIILSVGIVVIALLTMVICYDRFGTKMGQACFVLFINIIRILLKKLDARRINFNNSSLYRRLSKSTLFLIPLFGTHYIIFNFLPYSIVGIRLYLELCIGSFQGFLAAVLYCFLNHEDYTQHFVNEQQFATTASAISATLGVNHRDNSGAGGNLSEMAWQQLRICRDVEEEDDEVDHALKFWDQNDSLCMQRITNKERQPWAPQTSRACGNPPDSSTCFDG